MMAFRTAVPADRPALTKLWQEAFGDPAELIDLFFESGFAPERSRVAVCDGGLAAMLYWFDCSLGDERCAYIYAVATDLRFQGRGIASGLMADVHDLLSGQGYAGAILSPGSESLFRFYGRMGYRTAGFIREEEVTAAPPLPLRQIGAAEYAEARRAYLPENGIRQEGANLSYLSRFSDFFTGEGFVASVARQGAFVQEFLGDTALIPGFLGALGKKSALVRSPGQGRPLVMGLRFDGGAFPPVYFGFPFD